MRAVTRSVMECDRWACVYDVSDAGAVKTRGSRGYAIQDQHRNTFAQIGMRKGGGGAFWATWGGDEIRSLVTLRDDLRAVRSVNSVRWPTRS